MAFKHAVLLLSVAALALSGAEGKGRISIVNNCPDTVIYATTGMNANTHPVPEQCLGAGKACEDYDGTNPAFFGVPSGERPESTFCGQTRAELNMNMAGHGFWENISKVKGFNYPIAIEAEGHHRKTVCNDVNCADAYWLCDTAWTNHFSPVYKIPNEYSHFTITFCPVDMEDSVPSAAPPADLDALRKMPHTHADAYWCTCACRGWEHVISKSLDTFFVPDHQCGSI